MGDSAGGGLALAVGQGLRDRGLTPRRIVLISPWLDVATEDPASRALADRDPMLAIPGLVEAARSYAGPLALDDPRVSPLHGALTQLPPITVFTGTEDLLNPDSHRLADACAAAGVSCELIEETEQPHVYPLLPTREGQAARRRIVALLQPASAPGH
jgi:acetyl esterase/lipase